VQVDRLLFHGAAILVKPAAEPYWFSRLDQAQAVVVREYAEAREIHAPWWSLAQADARCIEQACK
jgi:hypothetical protein